MPSRTLPCANCESLVALHRKPFLAMVREGRKPLCAECGLYLSRERRRAGEIPGAARVTKNAEGHGVAVPRLVASRRVKDKRGKALASRRLRRVLDMGCEDGV